MKFKMNLYCLEHAFLAGFILFLLVAKIGLEGEKTFDIIMVCGPPKLNPTCKILVFDFFLSFLKYHLSTIYSDIDFVEDMQSVCKVRGTKLWWIDDWRTFK